MSPPEEVRRSRTPQQEAKRQEAISWLASGKSNRFTAGKVGVDESTIREWLKEDEFAGAVEERLAETVAAAERRLRGAGKRLADRLVKVALGKSKATPQSVAALRDALTRLGVGKGERVEISGGLATATDEELEAALVAMGWTPPAEAGEDEEEG